MKTALFAIVLGFGTVAPSFAADDPYPAYLTQLTSEINATHPTQAWYYKGMTTDAAGWTNYIIRVDGSNTDHIVIHVPRPGAPLDVAFLGDGIIEEMTFNTLRPDLATLNAGISGDSCEREVLRLPDILALAPRSVAIGCGVEDLSASDNMAPIQAAILKMVATAHNSKVPIIVATVTPTLPVLQGTQRNPMLIAQNIRTFNVWVHKQAASQGYFVWDRWDNIAVSIGIYGIPSCYTPDGMHPTYCQQQELAGFGYALGQTGWR